MPGDPGSGRPMLRFGPKPQVSGAGTCGLWPNRRPDRADPAPLAYADPVPVTGADRERRRLDRAPTGIPRGLVVEDGVARQDARAHRRHRPRRAVESRYRDVDVAGHGAEEQVRAAPDTLVGSPPAEQVAAVQVHPVRCRLGLGRERRDGAQDALAGPDPGGHVGDLDHLCLAGVHVPATGRVEDLPPALDDTEVEGLAELLTVLPQAVDHPTGVPQLPALGLGRRRRRLLRGRRAGAPCPVRRAIPRPATPGESRATDQRYDHDACAPHEYPYPEQARSPLPVREMRPGAD